MDDACWADVLSSFEEEAGDEPSDALEGWEICLLAKVCAKKLKLPKQKASSLERLLLKKCSQLTVSACLSCIREHLSKEASGAATASAGQATGIDSKRSAAEASAIQEAKSIFEQASAASRGRCSSRSRSRHRKRVQESACALRKVVGKGAVSAAVAETATGLLKAAVSLDSVKMTQQQATAESKSQRAVATLRAPACFGPPAFFPVGNAAGRFPPLSHGVKAGADVQMLFVGISDPRHLLMALSTMPPDVKPESVLNDLNAETCARNALLLALLGCHSGPALDSFSAASRVLLAFELWWSHEIPVAHLSMLIAAASSLSSAAHCCGATRATLEKWKDEWHKLTEAGRQTVGNTPPEQRFSSKDLRVVYEANDMEKYACSAEQILKDGCIDNITLQKPSAKLDYGLYKERRAPEGFISAGDGVLLWPEVASDAEFETRAGQPCRAEYLAALSALFPRFFEELVSVAKRWFQHGLVKCRHIAGDCQALPAVLERNSFDRIFTSNVADHVGLPALALSLGPLLKTGGWIMMSLSNNLRALDSTGTAESLCQIIYGIPLDSLACACGLRATAVKDVDPDVIFLEKAANAEPLSAASRRDWLLASARRLYRCPLGDPKTVAKRMADGECIGMANRYVRRYSVSPVTVGCLAALLEQHMTLLASDDDGALSAVLAAASHSQLQLARSLSKGLGPSAVARTLSAGDHLASTASTWCSVAVEIEKTQIPSWAWRTHPPVVVLWIRSSGLVRARAAKVSLQAPKTPGWEDLVTRSQVQKRLEAGTWGILRWAMQASAEDVQILDDVDVMLLESGAVQISFEVPKVELDCGAFSSAVIVSTVDNAVIAGPFNGEALRPA
eukprot:TRINITY_DN92162_c0_g1_i1.p1 TRINITY_DN92162_c0_g1~~TRINITY_DN92162_c0_g1_i1.p1  ORF type:complete len:850 (-),score=104.47 TRINITY_DN92162_c0_g1_i1:407-2956(-)